MNLRAADLRFVLPHAPRTAAVLRGARDSFLDEIGAGLEAAGVDTSYRAPIAGRAAPDLVVAAAADASRALDVSAAAHLLLGRAIRPAERRPITDRATRSLLVRGQMTRPTNVWPLHPPTPLLHYLRAGGRARTLRQHARNRAFAACLRLPKVTSAAGIGNASLILSTGVDARLPRLVAEAVTECGLPAPATWRLALGRGDDLQRALFYLFDAERPERVVKFCRAPGHDQPFACEEQALRLVNSLGGGVATRTPVHVARLTVDGLPVSVESAAAGRPLVEQVDSTSNDFVDDIAEWILRLADETIQPPPSLDPERARLIADVLPHWPAEGTLNDLVARIPPVVGVLQHNDLGSWNILADDHDFTVVDWESSRRVGFPLWDLLYFLGDVVPRLEGPAPPSELLDRAVALFAGRSPRSPHLFRWLRRAVVRLEIPHDAVGPIATMCWLHHGLSGEARRAALHGASAAAAGHLAELGHRWLNDAALGTEWPAWRAA